MDVLVKITAGLYAIYDSETNRILLVNAFGDNILELGKLNEEIINNLIKFAVLLKQAYEEKREEKRSGDNDRN
ncbi:hypothetical protein J7L13_01635 [bacterium]|nr:hypothetical protein [bacterium]